MNLLPLRLKGWLALLAVGLVACLGTVRAADDAAAAAGAADAAVAADAHDHDHDGHADGDSHGDGHAAPTFAAKVGYSYLTAYMFCLSLGMGSLFLVLVHHLFDAGWSVPVRRVAEQLSSQLPWMAVGVIPILLLQRSIYPWLTIDPATDHSLEVKRALFNPVAFNILLPLLILSWGGIARTFRKWSLAQDKDGRAEWTHKARKLAAGGIFYFAFSLTLVCFYLMKSLQHQFFSTMYGVYYFAGSVWVTLATVYGLAVILRDRGPLRQVVFKRQVQDLGVLFFAFTVFYAYIHFSQYFLIWNAAIPEETFWYVLREQGGWKWVGFTILFGHFFVPFLVLLNQDIKMNPTVMFPMIAWAWLMHYVDMAFNIMPVPYPDGPSISVLDPVFWFGMAGVLGWLFWRDFNRHPAWPQRDPRLKEAVTHHDVPAPGEATAHH